MGNTSNLMKYLLYSRKFLPPFGRLELWVPSKKVDLVLCYRMAQCASKSWERGFCCPFLRIIPAILKLRAGIWHKPYPQTPPGSKGHMLLVLPLPFLPSWFLTPTITSRCRKALAGAERCARGCIVPDNFNHGTRIVHNQIDWCTKANELLDFREKPKIWERLLIES